MKEENSLNNETLLRKFAKGKNTEAKDVWRRLPESNGLLRTKRCTPVSVRNQP